MIHAGFLNQLAFGTAIQVVEVGSTLKNVQVPALLPPRNLRNVMHLGDGDTIALIR